jgi:hypothetical protein
MFIIYVGSVFLFRYPVPLPDKCTIDREGYPNSPAVLANFAIYEVFHLVADHLSRRKQGLSGRSPADAGRNLAWSCEHFSREYFFVHRKNIHKKKPAWFPRKLVYPLHTKLSPSFPGSF